MSTIVADIVAQLRADTSNLDSGLKKGGDKLIDFAGNVGKLGVAAGIGFLAIGTAAIGFGVAAVKAAADAEAGLKQTDAVLKSTGGSAGVTAGHVDDLANSLMQMTSIDDDTVRASENMLLTFTNIKSKGGVFDAATQSALDMATALNNGVLPSSQQVQAQAMQLGKALNDPATGYAKLQRLGVSFTADQIKQIKTLEASGNVMGAQKIILGELSKEFGGSAAAASQTFEGRMALLGATLSNVTKTIGGLLLPVVTAIAGAIATVAMWVSDHLNAALTDAQPALKALGSAFGGLLDVLGSLKTDVLQAFSDILHSIVGPEVTGGFQKFNPVKSIIEGLTGVVKTATQWLKNLIDGVKNGTGPLAGLHTAVQNIGSLFQNILIPAFQNALPHIQDFLSTFGGPLLAIIGTVAGVFLIIAAPILGVIAGLAALAAIAVVVAANWKQISAAITGSGAWHVLAGIISGVGTVLGFLGEHVVPVLMGVLAQLWGTIQSSLGPVFQQLGDTFKNQLLPAWAGIQQAFLAAAPVLKVVGAIIGGILLVVIGLLVGVLQGVFSALGPILSGVIAVFGGIVQIISGVIQVVVGIFQTLVGLVKGIFTGDWTTLGDGLGNLKSGVLNILGGLVSAIVGLFSGLVGAVFGFVGGLVGGVIGFFQNLWDTIVGHSIIPDLVNGILQWIGSLPGKAIAFIVSMVSGIIAAALNLEVRVLATINAMVQLALAYFDLWKSEAISRVQALISTAKSVFSKIVDVLTSPIQTAKDKIGGLLADIGNLFKNLHLSLPAIKLPHFSINGSFNLNPPSVPSIGVNWYAKGGIVGLNGPELVGVGERGPEAIVPLSGGSSSSSSGGSGPVVLNIDGRTIARAILPYLVNEIRSAAGIRTM